MITRSGVDVPDLDPVRNWDPSKSLTHRVLMSEAFAWEGLVNTLHDRLAELADDAPTGGAPAAELWARGKRAHRRRAAAFAATLLVVGAVGTGIGVRLADGDGNRTVPARIVDISLPIEYPGGEDLPDLGDAPGPLAAVWLAPREPYTLNDDDAGRAPEAVGLVAETGTFGTLPIDLYAWVYEAPDSLFALSPDGRRIAYYSPPERREREDEVTSGELVVRDLVSGEEYSPPFEFDIRAGARWVDADRLVGHEAGGTDEDGWLWDVRDPGTAPRSVNFYSYVEGPGGIEWPVKAYGGDPPWSCNRPTITDDRSGRVGTSVMCDELGVIGHEILLGHVNPGASRDPNDLDQAVIALDISDADDFPFDDPALRRVVVTSGAPHPVAFATDLIAEALDAEGGAS
jgi:hypothetical protein